VGEPHKPPRHKDIEADALKSAKVSARPVLEGPERVPTPLSAGSDVHGCF
jgi:hypothetical protein